ncbi:hypothetical protein B0H14DRAFT_2631397 [Mycena olivaceomarginata]|nr:hypothetical protein B0H14DRAFT_2631397 [Mycena olivaceomarginata]
MAITEPQKSGAIRARNKNPPKLTKERTKPGPKPKNGPHTAALFDKDKQCQDLTYHDWVQICDHMEDPNISQNEVSAYFATRSDKEGGKLLFSHSVLSKKLKQKAEIRQLVAI